MAASTCVVAKRSSNRDGNFALNKPRLTLLAGAAVLAVALFALSRQGAGPKTAAGHSTSAQDSKEVATSLPTPSGSRASLAKPRSLPGLPKPVEPPHVGDDAQSQTWIEARSEELDQLSSRDDSDSLNTILSELGNSEPTIRQAALAAIRSFGSRDAIPWLEKYVAATSDTAEKKALEEAVEYLRLPTMLEHLEADPDGSLQEDEDEESGE